MTNHVSIKGNWTRASFSAFICLGKRVCMPKKAIFDSWKSWNSPHIFPSFCKIRENWLKIADFFKVSSRFAHISHKWHKTSLSQLSGLIPISLSKCENNIHTWCLDSWACIVIGCNLNVKLCCLLFFLKFWIWHLATIKNWRNSMICLQFSHFEVSRLSISQLYRGTVFSIAEKLRIVRN